MSCDTRCVTFAQLRAWSPVQAGDPPPALTRVSRRSAFSFPGVFCLVQSHEKNDEEQRTGWFSVPSPTPFLTLGCTPFSASPLGLWAPGEEDEWQGKQD